MRQFVAVFIIIAYFGNFIGYINYSYFRIGPNNSDAIVAIPILLSDCG